MKTAYRRMPAGRSAPEPERHGGGILLAGVMAVSLAVGVMLGSQPAQASQEAEAFVQQTIDDGYVILNDASLSDDERFQRFQTFMLSVTDIRRIARFTLGPYVRQAADADLNDFVSAFTDYAVTVYEDHLSKYTGQTMRVTGSEDREGAELDSIVTARVVNPANPNAPTFNVGFRVRRNDAGKLIIIDMQVEGVWLALSQRADFTSFLQRNNGNLRALSDSLRRQAQQIRAGG